MNFFKRLLFLFRHGRNPTFEEWHKEKYGYILNKPETIDDIKYQKSEFTWHYICMDCKHKWTSEYSPRGTYLYGEEGQTKCPKCKSPRDYALSYDKNGNFAGGAMYYPKDADIKNKLSEVDWMRKEALKNCANCGWGKGMHSSPDIKMTTCCGKFRRKK